MINIISHRQRYSFQLHKDNKRAVFITTPVRRLFSMKLRTLKISLTCYKGTRKQCVMKL